MPTNLWRACPSVRLMLIVVGVEYVDLAVLDVALRPGAVCAGRSYGLAPGLGLDLKRAPPPTLRQ
eukprot:10693347-Heterocapsa_arctica.AAC.1